MNKKDLKIEYLHGQGPGGQHVNRNATTVRITHLPTGISVIERGRYRAKNLKKALKAIGAKLCQHEEDATATKRKAERDRKVRDTKVIRTYKETKGFVVDHRSKKKVPIKKIMEEGLLDLLR